MVLADLSVLLFGDGVDLIGYASGATVQILLFAVLAIELKRRAPAAHTFLEVIRARYGTVAHIVYFVFGIMTNILVTAMLLTGTPALKG
jgi:urea-proton symporter